MAMLSFFLLPILIGLGARWSARAEIQSLTASNIALSIENNSYRDATGQLSSQISALQDAVDDPVFAPRSTRMPAAPWTSSVGRPIARDGWRRCGSGSGADA